MQKNKTHWSSLLILVVLGLGTLFTLLITFGIGINSIVSLFKSKDDPAGQMIGAFAFGFETVTLLVCSWFVLQKTLGREQADIPFKFPFAGWQGPAIIGLIVASVAVGGAIAYMEIEWLAWLALPVLTMLVIVPPIWLLFGIGTNGIELGPRWRLFGILGIGMTVGPLMMVVLEIVLLLVVIFAGLALAAIQQPDLLQKLMHLASLIQHETNQEVILKLLAPYISNPLVIATMIGYIAFAVPLMEELLKPLGVWIFARKIESPAQGFAMGLLSGAAFALIESLNASGDGSASWPIIVSVRAGTSLLHMTASGLVGWGIVSAFREKRIMRFFAAYFSAVAIHGLWNACAIGAGLSAIGESLGKPEWLVNYIPAMLGGMFVLGAGIFAVLIASNKKLRPVPVSPLPQGESQGEGVQ
jgi:hypothetical protein